MIKKTLKYLGIILLSVIVLLAIYIAFNFTYLKRIVTSNGTEQVRSVEWYEPKVEMKAATQPKEINNIPNNSSAMTEQYAEAIQYAEDVNSSAFLIWQGGELILDKYWAPYNKENYTQTHSIHKSLLSMLVGIAIDEGKITSIDDPASKYIDDWIEQPLGQISVKNLLTMTSGLGEKEPASFFLFSQFMRLLNDPDISAVARSLPQKVEPGSEFEYINTNPQLLVDVLESATGKSYETYLQNKIWSKMAANSGYLWMDRKEGTPHGYCCLMAQPEDLLRIGLLVLNKGKINGEQVVPKSWIEDAIAPSEMNPNYGYLMWRGTPYVKQRKYSASGPFTALHSEPYIADDVIFFDGFGGQRVYIIPSRDLIIVRVGETRMDFDDSIIPNRVISSLDAKKVKEEASQHHKFTLGMIDTTIKADHTDTLDIQVTYPANSQGEFPLIVFSHGNFLTANAYHQLIDTWVKKGYVVAAPTHLDAGGFEAGSQARKEHGSDWLTASRVLDMQVTANQISTILEDTENFKGQVLTNKYIAAGHSYGALAAQILGGASLQVQGDSSRNIPNSLKDDRVVGVVAFSPPGVMENRLTAKAWTTMDTPQLVITGTKDVLPPFWPNYEMHKVSYENALAGENYLLVLNEVDHYFGNLIGRLDHVVNPQKQALQNASDISLHFMQTYMNNNNTIVTPFSDLQLDDFSEVVQFEHR
ncbi:serine hydrolase [Pseudocolwellia sp. HL-MZ19]|uniref:serine hydrolase n=1 Tax=Pseudocolwellia sp. HL-MZ19 TaxID=3400846 RepID=UPI003CEB3A11